ncbi:hypothetical protein [Polynucleobacter sp.]|uniref:hypothetical protein n=1 Tax=Polynucleobacter sp. TaxID=2029855 RepID=UPI003F69D57D
MTLQELDVLIDKYMEQLAETTRKSSCSYDYEQYDSHSSALHAFRRFCFPEEVETLRKMKEFGDARAKYETLAAEIGKSA